MVERLAALVFQAGTAYDLPDNYYFGGGAQDSSIAPLAAAILSLAVILMFCLRRKSIIVPFLVAGVFLPFGINIVVLGFHFPALRVLVAAGWLRFALRRDIPAPRMNAIDKAFLVWALGNAIFFSLLWRTTGAVTNKLGFLWTTLGTYFLVRFLIRDKDDMIRVIRVLAILMAIIAPLMLFEHFTQHNLFSIVGSPPVSEVRDGAVRAGGPFRHPIIAGTVGAMLLPLFVGLWWQGKRYRTLAGLGVVSSVGMAIASASSTPLMTAAAGVIALLLWAFRTRLRILRWALVMILVALQLVMKAPVWMLISRTGGAIGGSGYHRAMLIDNFVRHFGEWFLIGTRNNVAWGYDMWDVDNAFVAAGIGGGLITFSAFIAVLVYAYKRIGKSRRLARASHKDERLVWAIGASMFANTVGFFGIVYFDQSILLWYSLLAMVSATTAFVASKKPTLSEPEITSARTRTIEAGIVPDGVPVGSQRTFATFS
jgi:hypothetical protein